MLYTLTTHSQLLTPLIETAKRKGIDVEDLVTEYIAAGLEREKELTLFEG